MKRPLFALIFSIFLFGFLMNIGTGSVLAHGGEEEATFNPITNVKQSIIALDQRQPNVGVIQAKLMEVIENESEVQTVDVEKVKQAEELVKAMEFEEASLLLFEAIGEDPNGQNPALGSVLLEYEKEFEGGTALYLLLTASILFVAIGGLLIKQSKEV